MFQSENSDVFVEFCNFFSAINHSWLLEFLCFLDTVIVIDSFSMICRRKKKLFCLMSQNVNDWNLSRECMQFSVLITVLDKTAIGFRAKTQMFLWSSVIFFLRSITVGYSNFCVF